MDTISILKLTKWNNSAKHVGGKTIVNLCMDTISIRKITKGNNSTKNVGGVTVFNLCMSSGHALYLCQVS